MSLMLCCRQPRPLRRPQVPGAVSDCNKWRKIASDDTCESISAKNAITVTQFRSWNTQINISMSIHTPSSFHSWFPLSLITLLEQAATISGRTTTPVLSFLTPPCPCRYGVEL